MTQFFSLSAPREKMSHFDPKNLITGGTKIWPKFLGRNDSFFPIRALRQKMSHFDLKKFNHWRNKNLTQIFSSKWLNFFASSTERKNESFWPKKIESLAELKFDPNF